MLGFIKRWAKDNLNNLKLNIFLNNFKINSVKRKKLKIKILTEIGNLAGKGYLSA